jgi:hypothetical protein
MHFLFSKTIISLLAFGQTLDLAHAFPTQTSTVPGLSVSLQEEQLNKKSHEETLLWNHAPAAQIPRVPNWGQSLGTTWNGFVTEPTNSEWDNDLSEIVVYKAWEETQSGPNPPPVMVAGLWVPGKGIYLGSVPHGNLISGLSAQAVFDSRLRAEAPILWEKVKSRTVRGGRSKWHAEDMAMYVYEREEKPTGERHPVGSYMFVWRQYNRADPRGPKPPCSTRPGRDGITPNCHKVLQDLRIAYGCVV